MAETTRAEMKQMTDAELLEIYRENKRKLNRANGDLLRLDDQKRQVNVLMGNLQAENSECMEILFSRANPK